VLERWSVARGSRQCRAAAAARRCGRLGRQHGPRADRRPSRGRPAGAWQPPGGRVLLGPRRARHPRGLSGGVAGVKVLFLLPSVPDPPDAGAKLRNLCLLRLAAAEGDVDALAFGSSAAGLRRLAPAGSVVAPPPPRSRARRLIQAIQSPWPDMGLRLWSERFATEVRRKLNSGSYDLVQAEGIEMARYLVLARTEQ